MEVVVEGGDYKITSDSGVKAASINFTLDTEFDDPMPTGDVLKVILNMNIFCRNISTEGVTGMIYYYCTILEQSFTEWKQNRH